MPSYSLALVGSGGTQNFLWATTDTPTGWLGSARFFGELATATSARHVVNNGTNFTVNVTPKTPEKVNTRSGAAIQSYGNSQDGGATYVSLVALAIAEFSHFSLIFPRRYSPSAHTTNEAVVTAMNDTSSSSLSCLWIESNEAITKRFNRRCTKRGHWPIMGNNIGHHQKTGGGAYSMRVPHFDNDMILTDPSAWKFDPFQLNVPLFNVSAKSYCFGCIIG